MPGIDRHTGKLIDDEAHIRQSIDVILTTPVGSRLMLLDFGLACLLEGGEPMSGLQENEVRMQALEAIGKWEPRIVDVAIGPLIQNGQLASIVATYTIKATGKPDRITVKYPRR